jgi:hypothetical protein
MASAAGVAAVQMEKAFEGCVLSWASAGHSIGPSGSVQMEKAFDGRVPFCMEAMTEVSEAEFFLVPRTDDGTLGTGAISELPACDGVSEEALSGFIVMLLWGLRDKERAEFGGHGVRAEDILRCADVANLRRLQGARNLQGVRGGRKPQD